MKNTSPFMDRLFRYFISEKYYLIKIKLIIDDAVFYTQITVKSYFKLSAKNKAEKLIFEKLKIKTISINSLGKVKSLNQF